MEFDRILTVARDWLFLSGPRVLFILVLAFLSVRIGQLIATRMFLRIGAASETVEGRKRAETLGAVMHHSLVSVAFAIAGVMIIEEFGVDIGPILAAAGVVGLAVGFGAQDLVRDMISGFFILLEDQIRVGDIVTLGEKGGVVEQVNLRMVVLRDLEGNVHYVRNGKIDIVTNKTKEFSRYVFDIGVAYREDVDEVIAVMMEVDEDLRKDPVFAAEILEPLEIMGLNEFGDSALVIRARNKTAPGSQWRVAREYNRRLKRAFDAKDIEIPFPHLTVYPGKDKSGAAPPLHLTVDRGT